MKFKDGVELHNEVATMDLELIDIMCLAERGYDMFARLYFVPEFTITSICDGKHSSTSFHYRDGRGRAFDMRTWKNARGEQLPIEHKQVLVEYIREEVPDYVDVVIEGNHIHIEIDKNG